MAWPPQAPHTAAWNSRGPPTVRARFAAARHDGHRCGSLTSPLLAKKVCSPAEKMNSSEQSRQVNVRSWYTLLFLHGADAETEPGPTEMGCRGTVTRTQEGTCASGAAGFRPGTLAARIRAQSIGGQPSDSASETREGQGLGSAHVARPHHLPPGRREPNRRRARPGGMPTRRSPLLAAVLLLVTACSGAATAPPGSLPAPTPTPSLGIEHATG